MCRTRSRTRSRSRTRTRTSTTQSQTQRSSSRFPSQTCSRCGGGGGAAWSIPFFRRWGRKKDTKVWIKGKTEKMDREIPSVTFLLVTNQGIAVPFAKTTNRFFCVSHSLTQKNNNKERMAGGDQFPSTVFGARRPHGDCAGDDPGAWQLDGRGASLELRTLSGTESGAEPCRPTSIAGVEGMLS